MDKRDDCGWEVSISEFKDDQGKAYKVTRRLPDYSISETKIFRSKSEAKKQLEEWLD